MNNEKKSVVIVYSYHHMNTEKIAKAIAGELGAEVKRPKDINPEQIDDYEIVGFGAGIDSGKHYAPLLDLARELPMVANRKTLIFSTSAVMGNNKVARDHRALREILLSKGYEVVDEFACKGFNTNSFLKYFGGMNKGRPNDEDIRAAVAFARKNKDAI